MGCARGADQDSWLTVTLRAAAESRASGKHAANEAGQVTPSEVAVECAAKRAAADALHRARWRDWKTDAEPAVSTGTRHGRPAIQLRPEEKNEMIFDES